MKAEQRKKALQSRRQLSAQQRDDFSNVICRKLMELDEISSAATVFSYLAAWDEVDLGPLHAELEKRGARLAYPVTGMGGSMEAYIPKSELAIETGSFSIKSPVVARSVKAEPEEFDVVIVPCVGFDSGKNRLGHGGGYYDRYLPKCVNAKLICVAFEAQRLESVSTDEHDIKPDMILTESCLII